MTTYSTSVATSLVLLFCEKFHQLVGNQILISYLYTVKNTCLFIYVSASRYEELPGEPGSHVVNIICSNDPLLIGVYSVISCHKSCLIVILVVFRHLSLMFYVTVCTCTLCDILLRSMISRFLLGSNKVISISMSGTSYLLTSETGSQSDLS